MAVVIGDVLILPVSDLLVRLPFTRSSHLPPPITRLIQAFPVYLQIRIEMHKVEFTPHGLMNTSNMVNLSSS